VQPIVGPNLKDLPIGTSSPQKESSENLKILEDATNTNLDILSKKVTSFNIFKTMVYFSGVVVDDSIEILRLVDLTSLDPDLSPWKLFNQKFGKDMSRWGWIKAAFAYFFLSTIIQKIVDAYSKNIFQMIRVNLRENGGNWKKFINGLIGDTDNLLEIYNGAAKTYAEDPHNKGNIDLYRKKAIEGDISPASEAALYRTLSATIIDHFSVDINVGFGFTGRGGLF